MQLRRLEIQGFKTFAQKTVLEFVSERNGKPGLTAVVGPNGSGKSNIADAIRWVIGEQSMRLLRAKKSEDLIFSGTPKRSRAGFAEVTMTIENENAKEDELGEIVITRRVYRDGKSEYEVNKKSAKLSDIHVLLAQSGFGQRTYSVIGQGMVDRILSASPAERKLFFDEAAGLRPFQIKREQAESKLKASKEKLLHTELVLRELAPRLSSLERQAKRLEERDSLKEELEHLETSYYGTRWGALQREEGALQKKKSEASAKVKACADSYATLEKELEALEKSMPKAEAPKENVEALNALREKRAELREQKARLEAKVDVMKTQTASWSPLPLSEIVTRVKAVQKTLKELAEIASSSSADLSRVAELAAGAERVHGELVSALEKPAPEKNEVKIDPALQKQITELADVIRGVEEEISKEETRLASERSKEGQERTRIFALQRELRSSRDAEYRAEQDVNRVEIEMARIGAKKDAFLQDVRTYAPEREAELDALAKKAEGQGGESGGLEELGRKLSKVRSRLEWIGGIDPAVIKEYKETKARFDELNEQAKDLQEAILSLETIMAELAETIQKRAALAFQRLNAEFGVYFKKLFNGGEAKLIEVQPEPTLDEDGNPIKQKESAGPAGFEISATPPGKRMKSIALLSGGERALTSIALLCAIMATNPSPFVVLDEVDAALDESNSEKFGSIIGELAERTQFVVITHNRATMNHAHVLYGVTMGDDGVSRLLSVKFEDFVKNSRGG